MQIKLKSLNGSGKATFFDRLTNLLGSLGETELKVLIHVYAFAAKTYADTIDSKDITEYLKDEGFEENTIIEALAFWRGAGFLTTSTKKEKSGPEVKKEDKCEESKKEKAHSKRKPVRDNKPVYSSGELADAIDKDKDFKSLVEFLQQKLKKIFNTSELAIIYSMIDYLNLPCDVIMLAAEQCSAEGKTSLRYIEKMLIDFADCEINTYEKAEKFISKRKKFKSFEGKVRSLCGLGDRKLTAKEKTFLDKWLNEFKMSYDMVEAAYEKTVNTIGKASLSYMNTILQSWFDNNIKCLADIKEERTDEDKSYDLDDFFKAAVSKTRGAL